jgi:hypothetical protein
MNNRQDLKNQIIEYLQKADDRFIRLVYGMIEADRKMVVGFTPENKPITREDLISRAQRSEDDIKKGRVKGSKQVRREITRR